MRRYNLLTTTLFVSVLVALSVRQSLADKRVALIIGNSSYQNVEQLPNPAKDAAAMAQLFKDAGFNSVEFAKDAGNLDFKRALRRFFEAVGDDTDIAVVYFAGHGIEVGGVNYMLPIDAKLAYDTDAPDEAVDLKRIMDAVERAKRLGLVILDACRNNPFEATMKHQNQAMRAAAPVVVRGLGAANMVGTETLVAYAAKANTWAEDGTGDHSPFTTALLHNLTEPGLDVRFALGRVRDEVMKMTDRRQEPFVYGSLGRTNISLVPPPTLPKEPSSAEVKADYELAAKVGTPKAWQIFINQYPSGFYSELAREELAKLTPPQQTDDMLAWEKIRETSDPLDLQNFMKRFPSSSLAPNAQHRLQILTEAAATRAWEQTDKNDPNAVKNFIKAYPNSTVASGEAQSQAQHLRSPSERTRCQAASRGGRG